MLPPEIYQGPDRRDRVLGAGTLLMLAAMATALWRGQAHWDRVSAPVWVHLATIAVALALTPVLLWRRRGDAAHRWLGYAWVVALVVTALDSFLVRESRQGQFSIIHLISAWVLIQIWPLVLSARRGDHARHRGAVRGMATGGLVIAGVFTLVPVRMLGKWLFGG